MEKYAIALIFDKCKELDKINEFLKKYNLNYVNNYFHITLAGFECDDENYLIEKIKDFANTHNQIKIRFSHLGTFLTEDNVVFMSPFHSNKLFKYHKDLKRAICSKKDIILCPYYKGKIWNPHCSIAYKIPHEIYIDIINNLSSVIEFPFEANITQIDIYEYSSKKEKIFETNLKQSRKNSN